ncbi:uncharacterized protein KNAG_0C00720 [Huiozyma naganishii CBS 8797]|uniref:Kinetochore protein SPC25 n=1 Tax=Huiozyma naganishii (strain ATCC MYA-139 / BCRC 22969 / CBS 8797 / KCTC 17520 / NBRC 10181 / NCYC 3082 / Yp74L-3) TaxID=1071383 RepID=J7R2X9_HUIN7|nr:hypothetical protein KNAG_0C00720 [Kazachstania naganishii CBS 8797]CCK69185.1 hypothetical protein KNAG_0C00720 [Kazachstania naganishii CBS 8797]
MRNRSQMAALTNKERELSAERRTLETGEVPRVTREVEALEVQNGELRGKWQGFETKRAQLQTQRDQLQREAAELTELLAEKQGQVAAQRARLREQRERDNPELRLYESLLGLAVDNADGPAGHITFTFSRFAADNMDKTCSVTVNAGGDGDTDTSAAVAIVRCVPQLDADSADYKQLEALLNETGRLPEFIYRARVLLVQRCTTSGTGDSGDTL